MKSVALLIVCSIMYTFVSSQSRNENEQDPVISNSAKTLNFNADALPLKKSTDAHFLLPRPVHGKVIGKNDNVIEEPAYTFNYDKADKMVFVYNGEKVVTMVGLSDLKTVEFKLDQANIKCEPNFLISKELLFEVLSKREDRYCLYKTLDDHRPTYYIITSDKQIHPISLSHQSIDALLNLDPKAQYFLKYHKHDSADENYLKEFVVYLNYF